MAAAAGVPSEAVRVVAMRDAKEQRDRGRARHVGKAWTASDRLAKTDAVVAISLSSSASFMFYKSFIMNQTKSAHHTQLLTLDNGVSLYRCATLHFSTSAVP